MLTVQGRACEHGSKQNTALWEKLADVSVSIWNMQVIWPLGAAIHFLQNLF